MRVDLVLGGLFFAALAGIGVGLILDHFQPTRGRRIIGWILLVVCVPVGAALTYLGLQ